MATPAAVSTGTSPQRALNGPLLQLDRGLASFPPAI
jgi:hypothetical protein